VPSGYQTHALGGGGEDRDWGKKRSGSSSYSCKKKDVLSRSWSQGGKGDTKPVSLWWGDIEATFTTIRGDFSEKQMSPKGGTREKRGKLWSWQQDIEKLRLDIKERFGLIFHGRRPERNYPQKGLGGV